MIGLDKKASKKSAESDWSAMILTGADVSWRRLAGASMEAMNSDFLIHVVEVGLLKGVRAAFYHILQ